MKVAVLNDIHAGKDRRSERLLSDQALSQLDQTVSTLQRYQLDATLILGDLVQNVDDTHDAEMLNQVLAKLKPIKDRCFVTSGNHEGRGLGLTRFEHTLKDNEFTHDIYGVIEDEDRAVVYLSSSETQQEDQRYDFLPADQIEWLDQTLSALSKPVIICSHHFLVPSPHQYNFYIEVTGSDNTAVRNMNQVEVVLKKHQDKIKLLVCAHSHWLDYDSTSFLPVLSLPSYSENILSEAKPDVHPRTWSLLDWQSNTIKVNCFSGEKFSWGQVVVPG